MKAVIRWGDMMDVRMKMADPIEPHSAKFVSQRGVPRPAGGDGRSRSISAFRPALVSSPSDRAGSDGDLRSLDAINCVYINPIINAFWVVDYRVVDIAADGKTVHDLIYDMVMNMTDHAALGSAILAMDAWYATEELMRLCEHVGKAYWASIKGNRLVDDGAGAGYRAARDIAFDATALDRGQVVRLKGNPRPHQVRLFRTMAANGMTKYLVTNQLAQNSVETAKLMCDMRQKTEQVQRELQRLSTMRLHPVGAGLSHVPSVSERLRYVGSAAEPRTRACWPPGHIYFLFGKADRQLG